MNKHLTGIKKKDRFVEGYACAAAIIAKLETSSDGRTLIREGGFSRQYLIDEGADPGDIEAIYPEDERKYWESK